MAKIKTYDTMPSRPGIDSTLYDAFDFETVRGHNQFDAFTRAANKAEAIGYIANAGVRVSRPGDLRVYDAGTAKFLDVAGLFGDRSGTVLVQRLSQPDRVVRVLDGKAEIVATYSYEPAVRDRVLRRIADGQGFRYITGTGEVVPVP